MSDDRRAPQGAYLAVVNPPELGRPRGFAHGLLAPAGGRLLFVAGQTAAAGDGHMATGGFAEQFEVALAKVLAVVRAAGGGAEHVARLTLYVTSMRDYQASRPMLRGIWGRHMGTHYPAMAVVEVAALLDEGAAIEIEASAVVP